MRVFYFDGLMLFGRKIRFYLQHGKKLPLFQEKHCFCDTLNFKAFSSHFFLSFWICMNHQYIQGGRNHHRLCNDDNAKGDKMTCWRQSESASQQLSQKQSPGFLISRLAVLMPRLLASSHVPWHCWGSLEGWYYYSALLQLWWVPSASMYLLTKITH